MKADGLLVGAPDLFVIRPLGRMGWIEVKAEKGILSNEQRLLHSVMLDNSHVVHIVRSLEQLLPIIEGWKLEDEDALPPPRKSHPITL